jgi:hypothetical protein
MIAPPFTITDEELEELFHRLTMTLDWVQNTVLTAPA